MNPFFVLHCCIVEGTSARSTTDEKETRDTNAQIKGSSGSWWRILKLGSEEWKLYFLGFFFLLIGAISKMMSIKKPKSILFFF